MTSGEQATKSLVQHPTSTEILSKESIGETAVEAVNSFVSAQGLNDERTGALASLRDWEERKKSTEDSQRRAEDRLSVLRDYKESTSRPFSELEDTDDGHLHIHGLFALESQCHGILQDNDPDPKSRNKKQARRDLELLNELFKPIKEEGFYWKTETGDQPNRYINLDDELQGLFRRAISAGIDKTQTYIETCSQKLKELGDGTEVKEQVESLQIQIDKTINQATRAVEKLNDWEKRTWDQEMDRLFRGTPDDFMDLYRLRLNLYEEGLRSASRGKTFGQISPCVEIEKRRILLEMRRDSYLRDYEGWFDNIYYKQALILRPPDESSQVLLVARPITEDSRVVFTLDHLNRLHWPRSGDIRL